MTTFNTHVGDLRRGDEVTVVYQTSPSTEPKTIDVTMEARYTEQKVMVVDDDDRELIVNADDDEFREFESGDDVGRFMYIE